MSFKSAAIRRSEQARFEQTVRVLHEVFEETIELCDNPIFTNEIHRAEYRIIQTIQHRRPS